MSSNQRNAFVCSTKDCMTRKFVKEGAGIPTCPDGHGKMVRQANVPYKQSNRWAKKVGK